MNIYFISGLGADRHIFKNITLPEGCNRFHLDWIPPQPHESLAHYAGRLAASIDTTQPFILAGLSFGGMLATEIAKIHRPETIILISSVPCAKQLPGYYHIAGKLHLHRLVPISLLKSASLLKRLFTAETPEEKKYLRKAIRETDASFVRWSLEAILNWDSSSPPANYIHIHGSGDLVLPVRYTGATHVIRGGGHLMVLTRAAEISRILQEAVKSSYRKDYPFSLS